MTCSMSERSLVRPPLDLSLYLVTDTRMCARMRRWWVIQPRTLTGPAPCTRALEAISLIASKKVVDLTAGHQVCARSEDHRVSKRLLET